MLNQFERWMLYYELVLKSSPDDAPFFDMPQIIRPLRQLWEADEAYYLFEKEQAALRIRDFDIDEDAGVAKLLINLSDKRISDPVFENLETGELRTEPKLDGEGVALSAHMLISLNRIAGRRYPVFQVLLEDVPGIGRTKLAPFLTSLIKKSETWEFTDDNGIRKKCRPIVDMAAHLGAKFRDDLKNCMLSEVELVSFDNPDREFDEEGYIQEKSRKVILGITEEDENERLRILNRLKRTAADQGYEKMLVRYKKPEGKSKSISIDTPREDAGEVLVMRSDYIQVDHPILQCEGRIRDDVVREMMTLLSGANEGRGDQ